MTTDLEAQFAFVVGLTVSLAEQSRDEDTIRQIFSLSAVKAIARAAPDRLLAHMMRERGISFEEERLP